MTLCAKNIFDRFCLRRFIKYGFVVNDVRLNRTLHYKCLTNPHYFRYDNKILTRLRDCQVSSALYRKVYSGYVGDIKSYIASGVRKLLLIDQSTGLQTGLKWYKTLDEVDIQEFVTLLNMEDSFFSWYLIMELHTWMLLVRLNQDKKSNVHVKKGVMKAFWVDVESRAKLVATINKNFKKDMRNLFSKFQVTLFTYDQGFLSTDADLADALWRKFFNMNCDDPRKLEALVSFIRFQINHMCLIDRSGSPEESKTKIWTMFRPHYENVT